MTLVVPKRVFHPSRTFLFGLLLTAFFFPSLEGVYAQENPSLIADESTTVKAKVLEIVEEKKEGVPGTDIASFVQMLKVQALEGDRAGEEIIIRNDYVPLKVGEIFYLTRTLLGEDRSEYYAVGDPYRLRVVWFFVALFLLSVIVFGGVQGVRGLLSLIGSLLLIIFVLLPGVLAGYSPLLVTISVSSLIIIVGSYITHGFNKTTTSAVLGMIATIIFTGALAYSAVDAGRLTGFESEEAIYLNLHTRGTLDFQGLLLGGILIGLLGVLYDVAIGQAISVEELHRIGPHVPRRVIYKRAIRIGREHIGALVNTLAIAYVGVSLPLLLLFYSASSSPLSLILNREIFATEILRMMVGSIGLVLAVPITTLIAVLIITKKKEGDVDPVVAKEEEDRLSHAGHRH